ncbi:hypothetical protein L3Q82_022619, partial [Scortum barcoo]
FEKRQAELVVSALVTLTTANMDIVYKDMVTKAHQEIAVQQIVAHLDSIRKDMVILEKSEFANLRSENMKMKRELEQLQNRLKEESQKVRAETKLDINLESSRISDMFTEQERKLMEASTEFHHKKADLEHDNMEISKKIDLQVASLKTVLESLKLETIRYLAGTRPRFPEEYCDSTRSFMPFSSSTNSTRLASPKETKHFSFHLIHRETGDLKWSRGIQIQKCIEEFVAEDVASAR